MNRQFWAVGSTFGGTEDVSAKFKADGEWYDGYADDGDDRNRGWLEKMNVGDILVMKSSATKGPGHSISFTKVKGVGVLVSKYEYYYFEVRWLPVPGLPRDFDHISYRNTVEPLRNDAIKEMAMQLVKQIEMNDIIALLRYKKQIILQGPPGTGKTKLAKEVAQLMTTGDVIVSPVQKVEDFFKTNKAASPETLEKRDALNDVLDEFHRKFPMTGLKALTLADYAFGDGGNDSFCWWLEYKLWEQGLYSGQAGKFKIYWKKDINDYVKLGFVKDVQDNDKAMEMVAEQVSNAANEIDLDTAVTKLSKGFVLKILNSYHPDTYFPVNNEKCINNILRILDIPLTGKNLFEKNKAIQEYFLSKKSVFSADVTNVEFMVFLFTNFDIQGEIEVKDDGIVSSGEYQLIQFHPSYSYEDFVRGITVSTDGGALPVYEVTNKILADFAGKAHNNPSSNYVLIIDEINRANLSSVLGELIYALEYRFDRNNPNETSVESMYALPSDEIDGEESRTLSLPRNLYILGTMNTADRSVGHIDYAIRRRFAFVDVLPKELPDAIFETEMFRRVSALFVKDINAMELEPSPYLSSEFKPKDVWLGHSYFIKQEDAGAATRFRYEILPILEEYIKDGVLLDNDDLRQEMKKLKAAYQ